MTITPYLLSDFGTKGGITRSSTIQRFTIDRSTLTNSNRKGTGYGMITPEGGDTQRIVKYTFDLTNNNASLNNITPVSYLEITDAGGITPGHNQSLDIYHKNGKTYLITGVKASIGNYSTQLARIPVSDIDSNKSVPYSSLRRIGSMNWVGGTTSLGIPMRTEFMLDASEENIAIWSFDTEYKSRLALYKMSDIHNLFEESSSTSIKGVKYSAVSVFNKTKTQLFSANGSNSVSFQGFALTNGGSVYVITETGPGDPNTLASAKYGWKFNIGSSSVGTPTNIKNSNWTTYSKAHPGTGSGVELENIQIIGGDLFLNVSYHTVDSVGIHLDRNRLYHFDKTLL